MGLYNFHSYSGLIVVSIYLETAAELIFFEVQNSTSRLASLFVSCIVHYSLSSCLVTLAILLCYQSVIIFQMV